MKTLKYISLIVAGVFLSLMLYMFAEFALGANFHLAALIKFANVFFATIIIGAVIGKKGWIFGLIISAIYLILPLLFGWLIMFSLDSSLTPAKYLTESFKQTGYWVFLVLISGTLGGFLGSLIRIGFKKQHDISHE